MKATITGTHSVHKHIHSVHYKSVGYFLNTITGTVSTFRPDGRGGYQLKPVTNQALKSIIQGAVQ